MTTPMGPESQQAYCPNCKLNVSTNIELKASNKTHILALLLCLFVALVLDACIVLPVPGMLSIIVQLVIPF
ncbi:uncharacterized protein ACRADG_010740 isoform 2-T2 [Cochliomyia hominivorax]